MSRPLPRLTQAQIPATREIEVVDEYGDTRRIHIPDERSLTVYVDKREVVTLMTLGSAPELLVLGYLRNQRLITSVHDVDSITVDWDVSAAAVKTRGGTVDIDARTAKRSVTTGCGQGTMFGDWIDEVDALQLPDAQAARIRQSTLTSMLEMLREQPSIHRMAGSVHGCALFRLGGRSARVADASWKTWAATTRSTPSPAGWACRVSADTTRPSTRQGA